MKIGIVQINGIVGDFPGNAKRLREAYRDALDQGADLVVSSEMSLVGYPPRDLVFKSQFVPKCLQALDFLASEVGDVPFLVGYVDFNESKKPGKPFRNAVALLEKGAVVEKVFKTLLPTYDVFDERRYFEPADEWKPLSIAGKNVGVTICEDVWTEDYLHRPLYRKDPVEELSQQGMDLLINLSASPYHLGKTPMRRELLKTVARAAQVPLVYCNFVGGNDQLIFDGNSLVVDDRGEVLGQLPAFREHVTVVDLDEGAQELEDDRSEEEQLYEALVLGLRDYVRKCGFTKVCLGLSGGIDSGLTAVLAVAALGADQVHGLTMPSQFSSEGSVQDSLDLAQNLDMRCDVIPIEAAFEAVKSSMKPVFEGRKEDVTEENMQARLRGLFLMSLSNKLGSLLLTTGNKSELAVGYCTMYGDMCGGLAVISDVPKTMVYRLARWINRERELIPWNTIDKPPSAELAPNQKDQDTLPPYPVLDEILELYVERQLSGDDLISEHGLDEHTVRWVQRRVDLNEWKRHQAAPGLRVTSKAFGVGRRYPIVQGFSS